jgi:hypothetical protein
VFTDGRYSVQTAPLSVDLGMGQAQNSNTGVISLWTSDVVLAARVYFSNTVHSADRLCGLVARVLGYRSGGPGSIPGTTRKKK